MVNEVRVWRPELDAQMKIDDARRAKKQYAEFERTEKGFERKMRRESRPLLFKEQEKIQREQGHWTPRSQIKHQRNWKYDPGN